MTTTKMGAQENECQIFENFKCVITILIKFDIHNSRTSMRNFLWCYYRWFITSSALEKCKTKNAKFFKLFCFFCFCPLKIKITQFPGGFLNYQYAYMYKFIFILGSFYLRKKKNFHIKTKENMQQNTEFPRTCSPHWRFVCCVQGVVFICGL